MSMVIHKLGRAVVLASVPVIWATVPATGDASTYDVWTCRSPDGSPASTRDAAAGWEAFVRDTNPAGGNLTVEDCGAGGALRSALATSASQPAPSWMYWRFNAPAGTSITSYSIDFDGYARSSATESTGELLLYTNEQTDPVYAARFSGVGPIARRVFDGQATAARYMDVTTGCVPAGPIGNRGTCNPGATDNAVARVNIYRGRFSLNDVEAPIITSVSGDAVTNATWSGSAGIAVAATDAGGGVYRLGVEVDGQVRTWQNLAASPCRAWPGTERTFLAPKPCPTSVGGSQTISTADLPEGSHTVRVLVEDAAGNQTVAYGPATKVIQRNAGAGSGGGAGDGGRTAGTDPGPLNGSPASTEARLRATWQGRESPTRAVRFNQRPVLTGQLTTPTGQPIKGAFVRSTITRKARNSPALERNSIKTDSSGRFRWRMPAGVSSQAIRLSYHHRVNDSTPVVSRLVRLNVAAGVRLSLSRSTARRGQAVKLTGRVLGRPMPKLGKVVELQARNPGGKWITFKTVRSRRSGVFQATYRFRKPGPARFQMRARVRRTGDYPYETGASPVRRVTVR
jgi:hypothetical protein